MAVETEDIGRDLLDGAREIGVELDWMKPNGQVNERRVYYALERGYIPAFKIGKKWCARRSELAARLTARKAKAG